MGLRKDIEKLLRSFYVPTAEGGGKEVSDAIVADMQGTSADLFGPQPNLKEEIASTHIVNLIRRRSEARRT